MDSRWQAVTVVYGIDKTYPIAEQSNFARGSALRLCFPTNTTSNPSAMPTASNPKKIYLCGQYNKGAVDSASITGGGTAAEPVYTLVGVGQPKDYLISNIPAPDTPANFAGDMIGLVAPTGMTKYVYYSQSGTYKWGKLVSGSATVDLPGGQQFTRYTVTTNDVTDADKIPAGGAFWYISRNSAARGTINWPQMAD